MDPVTSAPPQGRGLLRNPPDFSLVLGGPLFQLLRRAHLADDALHLLHQRVIVISLLAWLPLLVLSMVEGHVQEGTATVPFLYDLEAHVRFLVALPLLIVAELVVHQRMRPLLRQFLERDLVPEDRMAAFEEAVESSFRLRNSMAAEIVLIAVVYGVGILFLWRNFMALDAATWYASRTADGLRLSLAGLWYGCVSLPFFQFLLCRWYFRLFVWARFLWKVSRIELALVPTHPDRVGGLGFIADTAYAIAVLATAHGALLAGQLADRIFYLGAELAQYKGQIALLVVVMFLVILGPLLTFAPQLARAKRRGLREYGTLAGRYVREFDAKWQRGGAPAGEPLVGSADIQSLADLGNSYEVVRTMRLVPVTYDAVLMVAAATLVPLAPLLLTMMPLDELLKVMLGLLF